MNKKSDLINSLGYVSLSHQELIEMLRPLLSEGKRVRFRVKGRSMFPLLKDGRDVVELALAKSVEKGDLVLAQITPKQYVLHRVIKKEGKELTLMGDGNLEIKEQCTYTDIVGKVVLIIRGSHCISSANILFRFYTMVWLRITLLKKSISVVRKLILRAK